LIPVTLTGDAQVTTPCLLFFNNRHCSRQWRQWCLCCNLSQYFISLYTQTTWLLYSWRKVVHYSIVMH